MQGVNNQINKALKRGQVLVLGCHTADSDITLVRILALYPKTEDFW